MVMNGLFASGFLLGNQKLQNSPFLCLGAENVMLCKNHKKTIEKHAFFTT